MFITIIVLTTLPFHHLFPSRNASGSFSMEIVTTESAELRDAPLPRVEPNQRSTPPSSPPQACVHVYLRQDFIASKCFKLASNVHILLLLL